MSHARLLGLALLSAAAPGCLMVPYPADPHVVPARIHGHVDREEPDLRSFLVGETTREQVLLHLGEPEGVLDGERTFVYVGEDRRTGMLWMVAAGYTGYLGSFEFGWLVALRVDFDDKGRIAAVRIFRQDTFELVDGFLGRVSQGP